MKVVTAKLAGSLAGLTALAVLSCGLAGCITDRDWHAPRPVAPDSLTAERTLASAQVNEDAWPEDGWWRAYSDPQLDALVSDALAGSPSLQVAQARLREAQAVATSASAPRLPNTTVNAETSRQRYSANSIYPPPFAGNYYTDGRVALDFSYDLDFWGHNREDRKSVV